MTAGPGLLLFLACTLAGISRSAATGNSLLVVSVATNAAPSEVVPAPAGQQATLAKCIQSPKASHGAFNMTAAGSAPRGVSCFDNVLSKLDKWGSLRNCLAVTGARILLPSDPNFSAVSQPLNTRIHRLPGILMFARSTADVQVAVRCGLTHNTRVVPRSGGHSYEGFAVQSGTLLLDLSSMSSVKVLPGGRAVVGMGARLGPLYYQLWQQGKRIFPAGTCPTVGVGGHLLGGGLGELTRQFGAASDQILEATIVTAAGGAVVTASSNSNPDLFWALKGAGGCNFGIVTSLVVQTHSNPGSVTVYEVDWTDSKNQQVLAWFQEAAPKMPKNLSSDLFMGYKQVQYTGLFLGSSNALKKVLSAHNMGVLGQPRLSTFQEMSYIDAMALYGGKTMGLKPATAAGLRLTAGTTWSPVGTFKAKSRFMSVALSAHGIAEVDKQLKAASNNGIQGWMQFRCLGGALNRVPMDATAFPHRNKLALIQFYVSWQNPASAHESLKWIDAAYKAVSAFVDATSAYENYIDEDLGAASLKYYFGKNLPRLQRIKAKWDQHSFFSYPGSIPPAK